MIELTKNDLLIVGDINPKLLSGYRSVKNYSRFVQGGFVIANLEGAIVENLEPYPKTGKPRAGSPDEVDLLCTLGVQAVSLANNHLIDYGPAGIKTTCRSLASVGVGYFGVGRTVSDAMTPFFVKVGDAWVALIGIAQNEFGAPYGGACGVAAYNERDALCAIRQANDLGADRVIVLFHAGIEYVQLPSPAQRRRCHFLVEAGADAVICQHSHIAGPIERYKQGWISYGTGDFFATSQHAAISAAKLPAYAIRVRLTGHDKQMSHKILPLSRVKDGSGVHHVLTGDEKASAQQELGRLNEIITDEQRYQREWSLVLETIGYSKYRELVTARRWLRRLLNRIPFLFSCVERKRSLELCNLIRAESHRDILIEKLEKMCRKKR